MLNVIVNHLKFSYSGSNEVILNDIDMNVRSGDFVCLLGQSGCGKSTLLRLLAGLEKPSGGSVLVDGEPVRGAGLQRGMVFQDYGLFPWMTTGENITIALERRYPEKNKEERKELALHWMNNVGMDKSLYDKLPGELSGGQKQRCGIARAFAIDPPILLMDEPFGSLDAVTKAKLQDLVLKLWQQEGDKRKTVFFVTHEVDEALLLATDIYVLSQSPAEVMYHHSFAGEERPTRKNMYVDPGIAALRNHLISLIYTDANERASEESAEDIPLKIAV
ncbi:ABC transporter ATP-binding protein [Cloacibacillus evryensis]|uniref:Bicarbonate transport ATP-binding protein CmpD n=1 Tax=bioreactor metagenome TaxID=1076179 RepID=A0A645EMH1_9ZZZZ|nr:ABC transporter ATP-binding protein [Cloacibacillus evryensis]MCQ4762477.1 ABC transporter ATP-binding protein [Cloacibacillus evryensis]MEA5036596.1 ABC transporter ATP-binding protein [Cloacibacillus evryensis]